jgi:hypothetical protein
MPGYDDDRQVWKIDTDLFLKLQPVHVRHPDVSDQAATCVAVAAGEEMQRGRKRRHGIIV